MPDLIETFYDYPNFRVACAATSITKAASLLDFTAPRHHDYQGFDPDLPAARHAPQAGGLFDLRMAGCIAQPISEQWRQEHPQPAPLDFKADEESEIFVTPPGYSDVADHQANFFHAVRTRKPVVENEVFGNHAAIGCHLANYSYFNKAVAVWDDGARKIVRG